MLIALPARVKERNENALLVAVAPRTESADPNRPKPLKLSELATCTRWTTDTLSTDPIVKKPKADI
jgi:hypothetical protein